MLKNIILKVEQYQIDAFKRKLLGEKKIASE